MWRTWTPTSLCTWNQKISLWRPTACWSHHEKSQPNFATHFWYLCFSSADYRWEPSSWLHWHGFWTLASVLMTARQIVWGCSHLSCPTFLHVYTMFRGGGGRNKRRRKKKNIVFRRETSKGRGQCLKCWATLVSMVPPGPPFPTAQFLFLFIRIHIKTLRSRWERKGTWKSFAQLGGGGAVKHPEAMVEYF